MGNITDALSLKTIDFQFSLKMFHNKGVLANLRMVANSSLGGKMGSVGKIAALYGKVRLGKLKFQICDTWQSSQFKKSLALNFVVWSSTVDLYFLCTGFHY